MIMEAEEYIRKNRLKDGLNSMLDTVFIDVAEDELYGEREEDEDC